MDKTCKHITFWKVYRSSHVNDCKFNLEENIDTSFSSSKNFKNTASLWCKEHDMSLECHADLTMFEQLFSYMIR